VHHLWRVDKRANAYQLNFPLINRLHAEIEARKAAAAAKRKEERERADAMATPRRRHGERWCDHPTSLGEGGAITPLSEGEGGAIIPSNLETFNHETCNHERIAESDPVAAHNFFEEACSEQKLDPHHRQRKAS
jgi:hypothetical protein